VPAQLIADRNAIQAAYNDRGFDSAAVMPSTTFTENNTRVAVTYVVREGPQIFVDHVLIVGNVRTSTETIERETADRAGRSVRPQALSESQRRLSALGLFRRVRFAELRHGETPSATCSSRSRSAGHDRRRRRRRRGQDARGQQRRPAAA
jgi:outer membrane protein assembly factor BamA